MAKRTIAAVSYQDSAHKATVILDNGDELVGLTAVSVKASVEGHTAGEISFVMLQRGSKDDE